MIPILSYKMSEYCDCETKENIFEDYANGIIVCKKCWRIIDGNLIDDQYEKRTSGSDDHEIKRVGQPFRPGQATEPGNVLIIRENGYTRKRVIHTKRTKIIKNFHRIQELLSKAGVFSNILEKTKEVPKSNQISITSVNESLPYFSSNIREILASEENKQRAIKYVIHKRYGDKATLRSPIPTQSNEDQEESNPALSNRYYKNAKNLNLNLRGNATNENSRYDIKENNYNTDFKPINPYQRNKVFQNQENSINQENIIHYQNYPKRPELQNPYVKRRMQVSSSTNRLGNNPNYGPENQNYNNYQNMVYNKKVRQFNLSTNRSNENIMDINRNSSQERGILKFVEEVKNKNQYRLNDYQNRIPLKLNAGSNFSFGLRDIANKGSLDSYRINKLRDGQDYQIIRNSFQLINNKNTILSSTFSKRFGNQAFKGKNEEKKEYTRNNKKDRVVEINLLSSNKDDETPSSSRNKRKFGRFANKNQPENLSFKDEKEIVEYLNKKYKQDKIMDLFEIKPLEKKRPKNDDELKNIKEQLNKEIKKNKDNETKLKQMESNINAKNEEIKNKNKEMEELKNDNIFYEEELQKKEKEIEEIKNKMPKENKNKKSQFDEGNYNKLKNEFDEFKKKYDEINKKYDTIKKDNEQNIKDYNNLLIENEQNKKDYNELLKDYEDLEKENEQNDKNNKELDNIKKELKDALDEKNKIIDENKLNIQKNEELAKELEKLKKENGENAKNPTENKKKGKKNKKFKDFDKSDLDDNKLKNVNENLKEEVSVLKGEINKYNNEYNDIKKENESLQKEMNELKDLNNKIKEENDKIKGELQISNKDKEMNEKQKKELDDTKDKYNKLLEEYEKIKQNLNSLDNEKSLIKNEQKQLLDDYKKTQEENEKIKKDLAQLKHDYDSILKENESLKESKPEKQPSLKITLKSKDIEIKKEEKPLSKSMQPPTENKIEDEKDTNKKLTTINNIITDVNTNINDIINKINSNIENNHNVTTNNDTNNDLAKNTSAEVSVSFSVEEDKNKDDKKNLRLRKALQRGKKKQDQNKETEGDSGTKLNKSLKISSLAKQLENNIQIRDTLKSEGNESSKNVVYEQHESKEDNLANILENQPMTKSIKKKKKKRKKFADLE